MANWRYTIDVSDLFEKFDSERSDGELSFEQVRDSIVERIEQSGAYKDRALLDGYAGRGSWGFEARLDGLRFSDDLVEFNGAWDDLYDYADDARIWIQV